MRQIIQNVLCRRAYWTMSEKHYSRSVCVKPGACALCVSVNAQILGEVMSLPSSCTRWEIIHTRSKRYVMCWDGTFVWNLALAVTGCWRDARARHVRWNWETYRNKNLLNVETKSVLCRMWGGNASSPAEPRNAFAILRAAVLKCFEVWWFLSWSQH